MKKILLFEVVCIRLAPSSTCSISHPIRSDWQSLGSNIYLGHDRLRGEVERKLIVIWNSQDEEHQQILPSMGRNLNFSTTDAVMQHKRGHSQNIDYILANKDYMKPMETSQIISIAI